MKIKIFFFTILFILNTISFAKYASYNYNTINIGIFKSKNNPNAFGNPTKDVLLELEGSNRYKLLDLYWLMDRNDILESPKSDSHGDSSTLFTKINPRISLDGLLDKDLSIGPINEWFISYLYRGTNGNNGRLGIHNIGLGVSIDYFNFNYFKVNLMKKYNNRNYFTHEKQWDGVTLSFAYETLIKQFNEDIKLTFDGWGDLDFGLNKEERGENGKSYAYSWSNNLKLSYKNVSLVYTYQINDNFTGRNQYSSDKNNQSFGITYSFMF